MSLSPTLHRKTRAALRIAAWNAVLLCVGLALAGLGGELWQRLTVPFLTDRRPVVFVPGVGHLGRPNTEFRVTNRLDFWSVSRTNSLGFLDREPLPSAEAAASCHVAIIGDSVVAAAEVSIADKFQVQLEERAALELPHLNVTTSAFGRGMTGQISQLAYWDHYVRQLRPKLVVLVFVPNDYEDNFPLWMALSFFYDPDHMPHTTAVRTADGGFRLHPPDPDYGRSTPSVHRAAAGPAKELTKSLREASWFLWWLSTEYHLHFRHHGLDLRRPGTEPDWRKALMARPAYAPLFDDEWVLESFGNVGARNMAHLYGRFEEPVSPFYKEALAYTEFGLDEFKKRADGTGSALVILAMHAWGRWSEAPLAHLKDMAAERQIPVIDQAEFIHRQGATLNDAIWKHDGHWSPQGHRWAAQSLLEWMQRNQDVCA